MAQNAATGSSGLPPITYKKVIKLARQVLTTEGYSDSRDGDRSRDSGRDNSRDNRDR